MSNTMASTVAQQSQDRRASVFRNRNFVLHWLSATVSALGDCFSLIAMPWLVLSVTGDPKALGIVMALEGFPRALLMLVGGSLIDRYSPRKVLLVSKSIFLAGLLVLASLILSGALETWMLYVFGFTFGLVGAFSMPANESMLPLIVEEDQLQPGNGALMASQQIMQLLAPALAGLLVWGVAAKGYGTGTAGLDGIAVAFLVNAAAFAFAIGALLCIVPKRVAPHAGRSVTALIGEGFGYVWRDKGVRVSTVYMAWVGFFCMGPILAATPLLAAQRMSDGALSFGLLYTLSGIGSLLGFIAAGALPKPGADHIGRTIFLSELAAGLALIALAHSFTLPAIAASLVCVGMANALAGVTFVSWIQRRVPHELMGRIMSIVLFSVMGLAPVSMAATGILTVHFSLTWLITLSGAALVGASALALCVPGVRRFGSVPAPAETMCGAAA